MLYDELKDDNFVILAVALDAGGPAAVRASIRPSAEALAGYPATMAALMGWGPDEWARRSAPQYPCLIDEEHVVAERYGMTNVPMAVWIDEDGQIVRPAETPGMSDYHRRRDPETLAIPAQDAAMLVANRRAYFDALRDWVAQGAASSFALTPDEVRRRRRRPTATDVTAALHARLGHHLFTVGAWEDAKAHYEAASSLSPDSWTYFRQSMVLAPELIGQPNAAPEFYARVDALGEEPYFPPTDMPGIAGPPPWLKDLQRE